MKPINFRRNFERILFSDTYAVEAMAGVTAMTVAYTRLSVGLPEERTLASAVMLIGALRVIAIIVNYTWLRLAVSYAAVFSWVYFIMFVFLDEPSPYLPGAIIGVISNSWIAWRLQSEQHVRKDLANGS